MYSSLLISHLSHLQPIRLMFDDKSAFAMLACCNATRTFTKGHVLLRPVFWWSANLGLQLVQQPLSRMVYPGAIDAVSIPYPLPDTWLKVTRLSLGLVEPHVRLTGFPKRLRYLQIEYNYTEAHLLRGLPDDLEELQLVGLFNRPLQREEFPVGLKKLVLGDFYNHPLERNRLPEGLTELVIGVKGDRFYHPFNRSMLPVGMKRLRFNVNTFELVAVEHIISENTMECREIKRIPRLQSSQTESINN